MRLAAYTYAASNGKTPLPAVLRLGRMIAKYGTQAVIGNRQMSAAEMRAISAGDAVISAYNSRAKATSHSEWSRNNRAASALLCNVEKEMRSHGK